MKILFIIDKIELKYFEFNDLVTNFWLIKEFLERGNEVCISINSKLFLRKNIAYSKCFNSYVRNNNIFYENKEIIQEIDKFDLVFFRADPPVDIDYINATYVFDFVKRAKVINSPQAIRSFNEKLHSIYFSEFMTDSIVTSCFDEITDFLNKYKQIVLKPLNKCFGSGVMFLQSGDPNTKTIIDLLTNNGTTMVMVQEYIANVKNGDMRILTIGDKILKYSVRKMPGENDFKFNNHSDKYIVKNDLPTSLIEKFTPVAQKLNQMNIYMAGLDVIDDKIIEINVTSPCYFIKEINNQFGISLEKIICDSILTKPLLSLK